MSVFEEIKIGLQQAIDYEKGDLQVKISQIVYTRPNKDEVLSQLNQFKRRFEAARSVDEFYNVHEEYKAFSERFSTNVRLAFIRFTQNTQDPFYVAEQDYLDEIGPQIQAANAEVVRCYLSTPLRKQLEQRFPKVMFVNLQMQVEASDPRLIPYQIEENKLTTQYSKLLSGIVIDFEGEKLPMSGISKYFTVSDRDLRKRAYIAWGQAIEDNKAALDEIYDKLVKVRTAMGRELGYDGYSPLGYKRMQRNCYTREDIARFRANVLKYLVPLASKIRSEVGKDLGLGQQFLYDNSVYTAEEPKPIGTPSEMFSAASAMYNQMSPETGRLFDEMVASECFDVMSRAGKEGGGYCEGLPAYKLPFIFANWNGSAGDVDVLTHEFGHALEFYKSFFIDSEFLSSVSMETAEVHSMSMEFLAYPWLHLFFGKHTEEYKLVHIGGAVTFIPYGTIVDCFQQTCYDNPDMTPAERNELYNRLEHEFLPHMSTEGLPAFQDGRRWQRQAHIYQSPFYYIDYCFAQFTALQFLALSQQDYKATFEKYIKLLNYGGTLPFTELLKECDLLSPFEEESFKLVVASVEKILGL